MLLNERNSRYNSIAKLMEDLESTLKDAPCATWIRSPPQAMPPLESLDAADGEHPTNNETTRQRVTFTHLTAATANRHTQGVASRTGLELFHDKLCSFFTFDEYRRFLLSGFQGNRLLEHLRENQSYSGFVLQSLELLARRGLIDSEFFARLLEERPRRADEIFALAQQLNLRL
jgi:hypothetical protein